MARTLRICCPKCPACPAAVPSTVTTPGTTSPVPFCLTTRSLLLLTSFLPLPPPPPPLITPSPPSRKMLPEGLFQRPGDERLADSPPLTPRSVAPRSAPESCRVLTCFAQIGSGTKSCSPPCLSPPRRAKEIVLKFEGRLTRTRGYQAAGAEVRAHAGAAPGAGVSGGEVAPVTAAATAVVPISRAQPCGGVPSRRVSCPETWTSVPSSVTYTPVTPGMPGFSEVDVPRGHDRASFLAESRPCRLGSRCVSQRESERRVPAPGHTAPRCLFLASPIQPLNAKL